MSDGFDRRTLAGVSLALLLIMSAAALLSVETVYNNSCTFAVMGTVCECRFDMKKRDFNKAVKVIHEAFDNVLKTANLYDKASELSLLNATAHQKPFVCSEELYQILFESRQAYITSDGLFDISVKPLMDLWGFYRKQGKIPSIEEIEKDCAEIKTQIPMKETYCEGIVKASWNLNPWNRFSAK